MTPNAQAAVDDVEKFLAAWNASCMQHLGVIISQAGFDHDAPVLTTGHLHALLNALHAQRGERDDDTRVVQALTDATARLWSVPVDDVAARDTLLTAVHDRADDLFARFAERIGVLRCGDAETTATRPAGGSTGTGEGQLRNLGGE